MSEFTAIDLSQLPAPDVIEPIDYEMVLASMLDDLQKRDSSFTALVESDPAMKILEVCAYREMLIRQQSVFVNVVVVLSSYLHRAISKREA
ncbi:baseplate J/gp47 family protein [Spartinivicinus ruber]|uniref:hypothetical protein n=1 Tax=Spartinivicinus ruber TaxID=2683272 RepID=UPI0013D454F4|nr:hypothetical protein [Spartinivicinus ruber]